MNMVSERALYLVGWTCFRCHHAEQQDDWPIMADIIKNRYKILIGLRLCDLEDCTL